MKGSNHLSFDSSNHIQPVVSLGPHRIQKASSAGVLERVHSLRFSSLRPGEARWATAAACFGAPSGRSPQVHPSATPVQLRRARCWGRKCHKPTGLDVRELDEKDNRHSRTLNISLTRKPRQWRRVAGGRAMGRGEAAEGRSLLSIPQFMEMSENNILTYLVRKERGRGTIATLQ